MLHIIIKHVISLSSFYLKLWFQYHTSIQYQTSLTVSFSFCTSPSVHPGCHPDNRPWCDSPESCRRQVRKQPVWVFWRLPCRSTGPPGSRSPESPSRCDMPLSPSARSRGWWSFPPRLQPRPEKNTRSHTQFYSAGCVIGGWDTLSLLLPCQPLLVSAEGMSKTLFNTDRHVQLLLHFSL